MKLAAKSLYLLEKDQCLTITNEVKKNVPWKFKTSLAAEERFSLPKSAMADKVSYLVI
jgi:hypothetical protein